MPGEATWQWSQVLGVTISGQCWKSVYQAGSNDFTHTCLDEADLAPCTATVRFISGQKVKYTFTCTAIAANAGQVIRDGNDLIVHRFDFEDWS